MDCSKIKYELKENTMLLPKVGRQTVYFVVKDNGLTLDVLATTEDNKYELFESVDKNHFNLHPQWDYHVEKHVYPKINK